MDNNKKKTNGMFGSFQNVLDVFKKAIDEACESAENQCNRFNDSNEEKKCNCTGQCNCDENNKCFDNDPLKDLKTVFGVIGAMGKKMKDVLEPIIDDVIPDKDEVKNGLDNASEMLEKVTDALATGFGALISSFQDEFFDDDEDDDEEKSEEPTKASSDDSDDSEDEEEVTIPLNTNQAKQEPVSNCNDCNCTNDTKEVENKYFNNFDDVQHDCSKKPFDNSLREQILNEYKNYKVNPKPEKAQLKDMEFAYDKIVDLIKNNKYKLTEINEEVVENGESKLITKPLITVTYKFFGDELFETPEKFINYCGDRLHDDFGFNSINVHVDWTNANNDESINVTIDIKL